MGGCRGRSPDTRPRPSPGPSASPSSPRRATSAFAPSRRRSRRASASTPQPSIAFSNPAPPTPVSPPTTPPPTRQSSKAAPPSSSTTAARNSTATSASASSKPTSANSCASRTRTRRAGVEPTGLARSKGWNPALHLSRGLRDCRPGFCFLQIADRRSRHDATGICEQMEGQCPFRALRRPAAFSRSLRSLRASDACSCRQARREFTFERGLTKTGGGGGFADVWKRGFFAFEYKKQKRSLDAALEQLTRYASALEESAAPRRLRHPAVQDRHGLDQSRPADLRADTR